MVWSGGGDRLSRAFRYRPRHHRSQHPRSHRHAVHRVFFHRHLFLSTFAFNAAMAGRATYVRSLFRRSDHKIFFRWDYCELEPCGFNLALSTGFVAAFSVKRCPYSKSQAAPAFGNVYLEVCSVRIYSPGRLMAFDLRQYPELKRHFPWRRLCRKPRLCLCRKPSHF